MRTKQEIVAEMKTVAEYGRRMTALQNEGGEGYCHVDDTRIAELQAELDAVVSTEWSLENTIARRATWNADVKAAIAAGKAPARIMAELEKKHGFTAAELKTAIVRHGIK